MQSLLFYKFSQGDMSLNEYRVKHDNVVQIAESYENDLWDKVVLDKVVEEEFSDDEFDDLDDENQLKAKAMARDRTLAISFIMSSDPRRYKQVVRDLENDFLKGKNNYPKDVPTAYKLLNEYRTYGISRDSQVPSSTNLAFPQHKERKKIACNSCGLPDYTIYNCPRCSKNRDNLKNALKGKDPQRYKNVNYHKNNSSHQKKGKPTFAQLKSDKPPKKQGKPKDDPNLGFVQIDLPLEDDIHEVSLVTLDKSNYSPIASAKTNNDSPSDLKMDYVPTRFNYIRSKYTEYFTPSMIADMDTHGFTRGKYINFNNTGYKDVFLAECLVCGGRGFFGMDCQKCKVCKYN